MVDCERTVTCISTICVYQSQDVILLSHFTAHKFQNEKKIKRNKTLNNGCNHPPGKNPVWKIMLLCVRENARFNRCLSSSFSSFIYSLPLLHVQARLSPYMVQALLLLSLTAAYFQNLPSIFQNIPGSTPHSYQFVLFLSSFGDCSFLISSVIRLMC